MSALVAVHHFHLAVRQLNVRGLQIARQREREHRLVFELESELRSCSANRVEISVRVDIVGSPNVLGNAVKLPMHKLKPSLGAGDRRR